MSMKKFLPLFIIFAFSNLSKAEYGITIYEVEYHTANRDFIGYFESTGFRLDDLRNPSNLNYPMRQGEHLFYYKELVEYAYYGSPYSEVPQIDTNYVLIEIDSIHVQNVDSISIVQTYDWSYLWGYSILYDTKAGETDWMLNMADVSTFISFELCEFKINIHEDTPQTRAFVEKVKELSDELEKIRKRVEEDFAFGYTEDKEALGAYFDKVLSETEKELLELFQEYRGSKIVIISLCTC